MRYRLASLVVLASCFDHEIAIEDLEAAYAEVRCERLVRCGVLDDVAACDAAVPRWRMDADWIPAVRAGKARWNAGVARACLVWLARLDCDPTTAEARQPACFGVLEGLLGDGETCAFGVECISRECWTGGAPCTEACCLGVCVGNTPPVPGRIGDRCRHAPCAEGWCDGNLCVPRLAAGADCEYDAQCDHGLSCEGSFGTCTALPGTGEPCEYACRQLGRVCLARAGNICTSAGLQDWPCAGDCDCSPYYRCASGRCELGRGAAVGELCDVTQYACADPRAHCELVGARSYCVLPKPDGEACQRDDHCESNACDGLGRCTSTPCI